MNIEYYEYLHVYEISINESLINSIDKIESFLYECECAFFILDMTNYESFNLIKKILKVIDFEKFNYLNCILILNKIDIFNEIKINYNDIKNNINLIHLEMKLNDENSFKQIKNKINEYINKSKSLSSNLITKFYGKKKFGLKSGNVALSFVLVGSTYVGKTPFLERFIDKRFEKKDNQTIGVDKEIRYYKIQNEIFKVTLWDTAGASRFRAFLPKKYYNNADGILLLFDINNEESFEEITVIIKDIKQYNIYENIKEQIYLIGNKIDLDERIISKDKAKLQAKSLGFKYFEISCKINMNISEIMNKIILESYYRENKINNIYNICLKKKRKINFNNPKLNKYFSY